MISPSSDAGREPVSTSPRGAGPFGVTDDYLKRRAGLSASMTGRAGEIRLAKNTSNLFRDRASASGGLNVRDFGTNGAC